MVPVFRQPGISPQADRSDSSTKRILYHIFHGFGQQVSGRWLEYLSGSAGVVQNHISIAVFNTGIELWFDIAATIGKCSVSGSQFQVHHPIGDAAKSQWL